MGSPRWGRNAPVGELVLYRMEGRHRAHTQRNRGWGDGGGKALVESKLRILKGVSNYHGRRGFRGRFVSNLYRVCRQGTFTAAGFCNLLSRRA